MLNVKASQPTATRETNISIDDVTLKALLCIPPSARGLVVFVHGSGSSRLSPRNQHVAAGLQSGKLATLLFDLLTPAEEEIDLQTSELRFNIRFLAQRVMQVMRWINEQPELARLSTGLFGASTGAAAALVAAADQPDSINAIVSRGGRPDLAGDALPRVLAPALFIVGANDPEVLTLNKRAIMRMRCPRELKIVPGATHLFEEPGTLEEVTSLARSWFEMHLGNVKKSRQD